MRFSSCPFALALALVLSPAAALAADGDGDGDGIDDVADAFPCDGDRAAVVYFPSASTAATLLYEDNWPARGDLDFNDAVVSYHFALFLDAAQDTRGLRLTVRPRALGANIASGLALRLPVQASQLRGARLTVGEQPTTTVVPGPGELVVVLAQDLRALFGGQAGIINAEGPSRGDGQTITLDLELAPGVDLDVASDPFDLFFFRTADPSHEVHRPQFGGTAAMNTALFGTEDDGSADGRHFVDVAGLPFLLVVPEDVRWPRERVPVDQVWPSIVTFAASGGREAAGFYTAVADAEKVYASAPAIAPPAVSGDACVMPVNEASVAYDSECFDLETGAVVSPAASPFICGLTGDLTFQLSPFSGRSSVTQSQCADGQCLTGVELARSTEPFDQIDASDVAGLAFSRATSSAPIETQVLVARTVHGVYKVAFIGFTCDPATARCRMNFRWQQLTGAAGGQIPNGPVESVRYMESCFDLDTGTAQRRDPSPMGGFGCPDGTDFFFYLNNGSPAAAILSRNPCEAGDCRFGPEVADSAEAFADVDAGDVPALTFSRPAPLPFDHVVVFRTPGGLFKVGPVRESVCTLEPECHVSFVWERL